MAHMPQELATRRRRAALLLGCLLCLLAAPVRAAQDAEPGREIAALAAKLLADPLDAAAADKLGRLRQRQAQACKEAIEALVKGLDAYMAQRPDSASRDLSRAAQVPEVAAMADRALQSPLAALIKKCAKESGAADVPAAADVCESCGGTGRADCPACHGAGEQLCPTCGGHGKFTRSSGTCTHPKCGRSGVLQCEQCQGKGVVRCNECEAKATGFLAEAQVLAIRTTMAMARHLSAGGIDLDSPGALKTSPKLTE